MARHKLALFSIAVLLLAVAFALLISPRLAPDSARYIDAARRLRSGERLIEKQPSYVGYDLLVALFYPHLRAIIAFQLAATLLATSFLCASVSRHLSVTAAVICAALLLNPDVSRWNVYILTDSLYISTMCLWLVAGASRRYWAFFVLAVIAATLRPEGWFVLLIAACWTIAGTRVDWRLRSSAGVVALTLFGLFFLRTTAGRAIHENERLSQNVIAGTVVWGYPPSRLVMPQDDASPIVAYGLKHPIALGRLFLTRVATELAHVRPFYSIRHNIAILAVLIPVYILAIIGLCKIEMPIVRLAGILFVTHVFIVGVSFADWDGRFLLHAMPALAVLAGAGLTCLTRFRIVT